MATPVCPHEQADISANPRFRTQQRQVDPRIDAMSSPSRDFRCGVGCPRYGLTRCRDRRGTYAPSGRRFLEPKLVPIARWEVEVARSHLIPPRERLEVEIRSTMFRFTIRRRRSDSPPPSTPRGDSDHRMDASTLGS